MKKNKQQGFSLMEVIIALAVISISLVAIIEVTSNNAKNLLYLNEKTFASWVAMNHISEQQAKGIWPSEGTTTGKVEMAGVEWHWRQKVILIPDYKDFRRIEISVRSATDEEDISISSLVSFITNPAAQKTP